MGNPLGTTIWREVFTHFGRGRPSTLRGSRPITKPRREKACLFHDFLVDACVNPTPWELCRDNPLWLSVVLIGQAQGPAPTQWILVWVTPWEPPSRGCGCPFWSRHPARGGFARLSTLQGSRPITKPRREKACLFHDFLVDAGVNPTPWELCRDNPLWLSVVLIGQAQGPAPTQWILLYG